MEHRIITTILLASLWLSSKSQVPVTNSSTLIHVNAATTVFINGSLTEQGVGSITNFGAINLTGDFSNNATNNCFGTSTGTVLLSGAIQQVGGTSVTAFNNLSLGGTGLKRLTNDIIVGGLNAAPAGILSLADRLLVLNTNMVTVTNSLSSAITRTTGMVESESDPITGYGTILWKISAGVAGSVYEFPFGNSLSGHYLPFQFKVLATGSPASTGSGHVSVATYPTPTNVFPNNRKLPAGVSNLNNPFGADNAQNTLDRFWVTDVAGYSSNPVANITMTYRDSEHDASGGSTNLITESLLKAQRWDGLQWLAPSGIVNTASNTATVSSISQFDSVWTLAGSNLPLPIELLSFTGALNKDQQVDLTWITSIEINNDYFTLQRSADGIQFKDIAVLDGAGNSTMERVYGHTDENPLAGISYYRLMQTDYDGTSTFSQIISVKVASDLNPRLLIALFPNPAADHFYLQAVNFEITENASLEIYDGVGQLVRKNDLSEFPKTNNAIYQVQANTLRSGFYFLKVQDGGNISGTQKLIVK